MKLSVLVLFLASCTAAFAQILDYDIAGLPGGVASLAPSTNAVGGSNLVYIGDPSNIDVGLDGAIYANNWSASPSVSGNRYEFSTGSEFSIDYASGSLTFGASSVQPYSVTLYTDGTQFGTTQNFSGGIGTSDFVSFDLSSLGTVAGSTTFAIVFSGDTATTYGLDSYVGGAANAARNVKLSVPTTPTAVPEPSTYAAIAGILALGFVLQRRRRAANSVE